MRSSRYENVKCCAYCNRRHPRCHEWQLVAFLKRMMMMLSSMS
jgi:hypothetical protein